MNPYLSVDVCLLASYLRSNISAYIKQNLHSCPKSPKCVTKSLAPTVLTHMESLIALGKVKGKCSLYSMTCMRRFPFRPYRLTVNIYDEYTIYRSTVDL